MTKIKEILLTVGLIMAPVCSTKVIINPLIEMRPDNAHESMINILNKLKEDEAIPPTLGEDIRHSILKAAQVVFSKTIVEEDILDLLKQVNNSAPLEKEGFALKVKEKYAALMLARTLTNFDDCTNQTDSHAQIMTLEHTLNNLSICFLLLDDTSDVKSKLKVSLDAVIDVIGSEKYTRRDGYVTTEFAKDIRNGFGNKLPIPTWAEMIKIMEQLKTEFSFSYLNKISKLLEQMRAIQGRLGIQGQILGFIPYETPSEFCDRITSKNYLV
jgi:hypothetical protein